ncbi:hypothetical protein [Catellatospora sp. NPDC049609]|uniref:hypothetical protein n=1 Tax=Catellatospora sp. NPDC049609 TaxID=3155505 RepID=UPI003411F7F7
MNDHAGALLADLLIAEQYRAIERERYLLPDPLEADTPANQARRREVLLEAMSPCRTRCRECGVTGLAISLRRRVANHSRGYRALQPGQKPCTGSGRLITT